MPKESTAGAAGKKLALLIASPGLGLTGPTNDVQSMLHVLMTRRFEVHLFSSYEATREAVLDLWNMLIERASSEDAVVIYYSGHGGLVRCSKSSRVHKFIGPFELSDSMSHGFRGILDIEISDLLRKTTKKTQNVTLILDCCYSSRTAWDPWHGSDAARKSLRGVQYHDLSWMSEHASLEVDQSAVIINASHPEEVAWEYKDDRNMSCGVFTRAFTVALREDTGDKVSWRSLMFRVCELVASEFPSQQPQFKGPSNCVPFTRDTKMLDSIPVFISGTRATIQGGRVAGVKEGSIYTVMQPHRTEPSEMEKVGDARVTRVNHETSNAEFSLAPETGHSDTITGTGFIKTEAVYRWPVRLSEDIAGLRERIQQSEYLRLHDVYTDTGHLVEFHQHETTIFGFTRKGAMCISSKDVEDAVLKAEELAKAQHLMTLSRGSGDASLQHDLDIQFRIASSENIFRNDGTDSAREGQHARITLHNKSTETVYVSVFSINVWGRVHHVNFTCPLGISLLPNRTREIGHEAGSFPESGKSIALRWPESLPRDRPVQETLLFIVTKEEVDLTGFAQPRDGSPQHNTSELQDLANRLSFSSGYELPQNQKVRTVPYDIQRISWTLHPDLRTASPEQNMFSAANINGNIVNIVHGFPNCPFSDSGSAESSNYILVHANKTLYNEQLVELDEEGATLLDCIDDRLYLFHYGPADLQPIRHKAYVMDVSVYPKTLKVDLELQKIGRCDPESVQDIIVAFHETERQNTDSIIVELDRIAGPTEKKLIHYRDRVQISAQASTVFDLAAVDGVRTIQEVLEKVSFNNLARHTMSANHITLNNTLYKGNGQTVAVADTGLDGGHIHSTHAAFRGRVIDVIPIWPLGTAIDRTGHGSHVCGSVLGDVVLGANDPTLQGIAPGASLILQALTTSTGHLNPGSLTSLFHGPYENHGARIHNNSWGTGWRGRQLKYDLESEDIDDFVWEKKDLLICFAAGNYRERQLDPTLGSEAAAKNCLTVGAIDAGRVEKHDASTRPRQPDGISCFSSHGPTREKRIKPDVVAPGRSIMSTRSTSLYRHIASRKTTSNDGYFIEFTGTSMATALVSGCAAVLREVLINDGFENPSAALMKALLINGADSFTQASFSTEGFGRMNLENSIAHVGNSQTAGILEGDPLTEGDQRTVSVSNEAPDKTLKATMAYSDKAKRKLWNNLNLIVRHQMEWSAMATREPVRTMTKITTSNRLSGKKFRRAMLISLFARLVSEMFKCRGLRVSRWSGESFTNGVT